MWSLKSILICCTNKQKTTQCFWQLALSVGTGLNWSQTVIKDSGRLEFRCCDWERTLDKCCTQPQCIIVQKMAALSVIYAHSVYMNYWWNINMTAHECGTMVVLDYYKKMNALYTLEETAWTNKQVSSWCRSLKTRMHISIMAFWQTVFLKELFSDSLWSVHYFTNCSLIFGYIHWFENVSWRS